jgi:oligopeptide/dipeptide ABC transporter ATP-binding protein
MTLVIDALALRQEDGTPLLGPLSLSLAPGDRLGLVGESGSGKSLLLQALFGVLPDGVVRASGSLLAFGLSLDQPEGRQLRGARLGWVPQEPLQALNPLLSVGELLALLPAIHRQESRARTLARLAPLLERLGLPPGPEFQERFPHQLSGGQRQRICLAMALSCDPQLLVLDEPTTALDPLAQREFLDLVLGLQRERGLGFLWITHDLALAGLACERLLVIYGGAALEAGPAPRLLSTPRHPYTARLMEAAHHQPATEGGFLPDPKHRPTGCPYRPRCPRAQAGCEHWGPWRGTINEGVRCERPLDYPN